MPIISTDVSRGAHLLREGRLVAFATETVYGIGAAAANADALAELYRRKERPLTHPVIVHISDFAAASDWAAFIPPPARLLAQHFCPGPLTLLLPRGGGVNAMLCGGGGLIALRVPSHPLARRLLEAFGGGVAAPSANRHGCVSPTTPAHVVADFSDMPELLVLDGGNCDIGIESTIVGFSTVSPFAPFIVRPGSINATDISRILAEAGGTMLLPKPPSLISAPGNMLRHYAPATPLRLATTAEIMAISERDSVAVLSRLPPPQLNAAHWRRAATIPDIYAHHLYRYLRELDSLRLSLIMVENPSSDSFSDGGSDDWRAVHDRLRRAATTTA